MKIATQDPDEYRVCLREFEKRERKFYLAANLSKRRKKILPPGEGLYLDDTVQMRWMTWRGCWDFLTPIIKRGN